MAPTRNCSNTPTNVRFRGKSGHRLVHCTCLLLTQSGHGLDEFITKKCRLGYYDTDPDLLV